MISGIPFRSYPSGIAARHIANHRVPVALDVILALFSLLAMVP